MVKKKKTVKIVLIIAAVLLCAVFYFVFAFARMNIKILNAACEYNSEEYEDIKVSEKSVSNRALGHGFWEYEILYTDGQEKHTLHLKYFKTLDRESVNLKVVLEKIEGASVNVKIYKGNDLELETSTDNIDAEVFALGI